MLMKPWRRCLHSSLAPGFPLTAELPRAPPQGRDTPKVAMWDPETREHLRPPAPSRVGVASLLWAEPAGRTESCWRLSLAPTPGCPRQAGGTAATPAGVHVAAGHEGLPLSTVPPHWETDRSRRQGGLPSWPRSRALPSLASGWPQRRLQTDVAEEEPAGPRHRATLAGLCGCSK